MIPIKIITKEQAIKIGLAKKSKTSGGSVMGVGGVIREDESGETTMETQIFRDGSNELIFMHPERKEYLKKTNALKGYLKQFKKIPEELQNELHS